MKAISLLQPWASLIVFSLKMIETRSWNTMYRGPLAIHASKGTKYTKGWGTLLDSRPFCTALASHDRFHLPVGAVLGTCDLIHVERITDPFLRVPFSTERSYKFEDTEWIMTENERAFGDYSEGRYMWFLANIRVFETPIPAKGSLGLWNFSYQEVA